MASEKEATKSATEVFGTYELTEKILIDVLNHKTKTRGIDEDAYLSQTSFEIYYAGQIREICRLQRVKFAFRDVIARSNALNIATFRRYGYIKGNEENTGANGSQLVLNPLLANLYQCTGTYYTSVGIWKRWVGFGIEDENYLQVSVMVGGVPKPLPRFGTWRSMLVANKPMDGPHKMDIEVHRDSCKIGQFMTDWDHDMTLGELAYKIDMFVREEALSGHGN